MFNKTGLQTVYLEKRGMEEIQVSRLSIELEMQPYATCLPGFFYYPKIKLQR